MSAIKILLIIGTNEGPPVEQPIVFTDSTILTDDIIMDDNIVIE